MLVMFNLEAPLKQRGDLTILYEQSADWNKPSTESWALTKTLISRQTDFAFRESRKVGRRNFKPVGIRSPIFGGRVACAYVQPATVKAHAPVPTVRFLTSGFGRRSREVHRGGRGSSRSPLQQGAEACSSKVHSGLFRRAQPGAVVSP